MKSFKKLSTKRKAYLLYVIPALIIHELSHIFFYFLFIKRFSVISCKYDSKNQHWFVELRQPPLSVFQQFFVSYAPLITMITVFWFGIFVDPLFFILFTYQLTANTAFPSKQDRKVFEETYNFYN